MLFAFSINLLGNFCENGMINLILSKFIITGNRSTESKCLINFRQSGQRTRRFLIINRIRIIIPEKIQKTRVADCMSTMNENSRKPLFHIEITFA